MPAHSLALIMKRNQLTALPQPPAWLADWLTGSLAGWLSVSGQDWLAGRPSGQLNLAWWGCLLLIRSIAIAIAIAQIKHFFPTPAQCIISRCWARYVLHVALLWSLWCYSKRLLDKAIPLSPLLQLTLPINQSREPQREREREPPSHLSACVHLPTLLWSSVMVLSWCSI